MTEARKEEIWAFIIEKLVPLLMPVLFVAVGFVYGRLADHEGRLIRIEASRFTVEMGQTIREKIQEMELRISRNELREPPKWFIDRVERLEDQIEMLRVDIKKVGH